MANLSFPKLEEEVLKYWEDNQVFKQTLEKPSPQGEFVFYEGPPTANGKPGIHHMLARAFKDLIPRYKTMQGFHVTRKAGWDTHGLPVELQVEKKLKISGKPQIEKYGIAEFNAQCKESVWEYKDEWEKFTKRMGYWVDMLDPYVTYHNNYIESLWSSIKKIHDRELLYKGHKVVPHCSRCGTALSSHEVAQGYKEVDDTSVYVKFRLKSQKSRVKSLENLEDPVYILSWTTTPWTLPGNVALAVGKDIEYVLIDFFDPLVPSDLENIGSKGDGTGANLQKIILAKDLLTKLDVLFKIPQEKNYRILETFKGKALLDLEYEPLFPEAIPESAENYDKAFKVYAADFVTTTDGTGVVHTAVMYGEDDYQLGEAIKLPKHHTVTPDGRFDFQEAKHKILQSLHNQPVKHKDKPTENKTTQLIIEYLESEQLLFKQEVYKHDYPFCWRCDTPLLYYAKDSWFIAMSKLREQLKERNQTVNWIPEHIQQGRFGEWLDGIKDWALSRERYWGTPLPVWQSEDEKHMVVIGSRKELYERAVTNKPTRILFVRHGESEKNVKGISSSATDQYPLTDIGEQHAVRYAQILSQENIDVMYTSPVLRAQQTATIINKKLGIELIADDRLREQTVGDFEGYTKEQRYESEHHQKYKQAWRLGDNQEAFGIPYGVTGESFAQAQARIVSFLREVATKHQGQTVLVTAHQFQLVALLQYFGNLSAKAVLDLFLVERTQVGQPPFEFYLNQDGTELDLHRPTIDDIVIAAKDGTELRRDTAVLDCWFDSGAMPFAQYHYPFENKQLLDGEDSLYPADFISEAIDQTRGWFYTLLAIATLLERPAPYKNVICLAHINDKHGKKMSKSKGNIVDPWEMMETHGADALRMLFYTMNQPGETKNFDPRAVEEIVKKNWLIVFNVVSFYSLYKDKAENRIDPKETKHILDQWLYHRVGQLVNQVTQKLDSYDVTIAGREIILFINELSTVYVQYSRDRFKRGGAAQVEAVSVLEYTLRQLALLLAPFAPFVAEYLYKQLAGENNEYTSVHMQEWPESKAIDEQVLQQVAELTTIIERALALRAAAEVKVRQPLSELVVTHDISAELREIVATRLNVKQVSIAKTLPTGDDWVVESDVAALNKIITRDLKQEGLVRELTRHINSLRKQAKLTPDDTIVLSIVTSADEINEVLKIHGSLLQQTVIAKEIQTSDLATNDAAIQAVIEGNDVVLSIVKVK